MGGEIILGALVASFLFSVLAVEGVRRLSLVRGWVARPREDRWHERVTALHGGVGIFLAFGGVAVAMGWLWLVPGEPEVRLDTSKARGLSAVLGGATLLFLGGLLDDCLNFRASVKLLLQIVAGAGFLYLTGIPALFGMPALDAAVSLFWFIGIVNAVNLLDNMDGVSAGVTGIGLVGVAVLTLLGGADAGEVLPAVWLALLLAAALGGFLVHNRPPARIFMGDSGSLFIGFVFAALALPTGLNGYYGVAVGPAAPENWEAALLAVTLAAIPILDTSVVTFTRLWRGQSPSKGGKDHTTHRLVYTGLTAGQTLLVLYGVAVLCVGAAVVMQRVPGASVLIFLLLVLAFILVAFYLGFAVVVRETRKSAEPARLAGVFLNRVPVIKLVLDIPIVLVAFYAAYLLRFDFALAEAQARILPEGMLLAVVACTATNLLMGIYRLSWRDSNQRDLLSYVGAAVLGTIATVALTTLVTRFAEGHSRGALAIFGLLYFVGLLGSRYGFVLLDQAIYRMRTFRGGDAVLRVLVYGAGRDGRYLAGNLDKLVKGRPCKIVGYVDDDSQLRGNRISGILIANPEDWSGKKQLRENGRNGYAPTEIWIASGRVTTAAARQLRDRINPAMKLRRFRIELEEE